jgi:hypothetical protein
MKRQRDSILVNPVKRHTFDHKVLTVYGNDASLTFDPEVFDLHRRTAAMEIKSSRLKPTC